jgi:6-phosphogluconate dehydrogenase
MKKKEFDIGLIGLGVMGRNLILNLNDHGASVAGYDKDMEKVKAFNEGKGKRQIWAAADVENFVSAIRIPRKIVILVPAGNPVDAVLREILPLLGKKDLLIDGGNSHFTDTDLRAEALAESGVSYLGVGISGGEHGARHGPCMMPGGPREGYERVRELFESAAAQVNGEPCAAYLGPGSAGHYVKMVHNGIEYGLMQLIAETYHILKQSLGLSDKELHLVYNMWNQGRLSSFLIEITSHIFVKRDEETGNPLIDVILDEAKQKGTGMWTSQGALELQVPVPLIDMAVMMRNLSARETERAVLSSRHVPHKRELSFEKDGFIELLEEALYTAAIVAYAQGMSMLSASSEKYGYNLNLEDITRIWRGGCIIRSAILEDIREVYRGEPGISNFLLHPEFVDRLRHGKERLREMLLAAIPCEIPMPAFCATLSYLDAFESKWLPTNLIQAQRDYFGAHTYERIDEKGQFHTRWEEAY